MKQKVVLIVSVVVGLLAAFLTHSYLSAKDRELRKKEKDFFDQYVQVRVMAAKQDLPSGTILKSDDLTPVKAVKLMVQGKAIEEDNQSILYSKKTARSIAKGTVIFWSDIEGGGPDARGLSADIQNGMRAVSVDVSGAASVSGMVQPNDHVDLLGTFTLPSKDGGEMELITMTVLQDVLVMATGKETAKSRLFSNNPAGSSYNTVTLLVNLREAEVLEFSKQMKGRLSLALRNPDDISIETTLPRVDFKRIQSELENMNKFRQENILKRRRIN